jgi:RNA polymerase sigma-70 factor (ECF subfamily)
MTNESDQKILANIAKGDTKSFETLFLKYEDLVYGYCLKMLKNTEKAEDITQETWLKVIRNAERYKPTGNVRSWIMSIANNLIIDEFRASKKLKNLDDEEWAMFEDVQADVEKLFNEHEKYKWLNKAFDDLIENQKIVLSLILIEELSQAEVALKLNTSIGAVKAVLFRAREALRKNARNL